MVSGFVQDHTIGISAAFAAPEIFGIYFQMIKERFNHENKRDVKYYKKSDVYAFAVIMVHCVINISMKSCIENKLGKM